MCEECSRIAAKLPKDTVTAIEAHRAEIIDMMTEINSASNRAAIDQAMDEEGNTEADLAILFSPYVIGFICGWIMRSFPLA